MSAATTKVTKITGLRASRRGSSLAKAARAASARMAGVTPATTVLRDMYLPPSEGLAGDDRDMLRDRPERQRREESEPAEDQHRQHEQHDKGRPVGREGAGRGGAGVFAAMLPAMASTGRMNRNRPSSIAIPCSVVWNGCAAP